MDDQGDQQDESEFNADEQAQPPPEDFETEAPEIDDVDFEEKDDGENQDEESKQDDDDGIELDEAPPEGDFLIWSSLPKIVFRDEWCRRRRGKRR